MSLVQIEVCPIDLIFFHFSHGDVLLLDSRIEAIIYRKFSFEGVLWWKGPHWNRTVASLNIC